MKEGGGRRGLQLLAPYSREARDLAADLRFVRFLAEHAMQFWATSLPEQLPGARAAPIRDHMYGRIRSGAIRRRNTDSAIGVPCGSVTFRIGYSPWRWRAGRVGTGMR